MDHLFDMTTRVPDGSRGRDVEAVHATVASARRRVEPLTPQLSPKQGAERLFSVSRMVLAAATIGECERLGAMANRFLDVLLGHVGDVGPVMWVDTEEALWRGFHFTLLDRTRAVLRACRARPARCRARRRVDLRRRARIEMQFRVDTDSARTRRARTRGNHGRVRPSGARALLAETLTGVDTETEGPTMSAIQLGHGGRQSRRRRPNHHPTRDRSGPR